jgi:vitamin B12/bleomycin/antimicrobial peptide transport system ATP-binding/permease protein
MLAKTRAFLHDLWSITRPYWRSEERWASGGLLAVVVALNLGIVYLNVLFNQWYALFYNALQEKDFAAFIHQFIRFGGLAAVFIVFGVYRLYLQQMLQIRWRRWLTKRYAGEWLSGRAYYRMQLTGSRTDNPDQRISEDVNGFVTRTLTLGLGLLESVVTLASFAAILWGLSGTLEIGGIAVPGYMLWAAVIYAIAGTWLIHRIGRPLIGLNFQQQQFEADFRFSLVRLRENAEGVALYGGEGEEAKSLSRRFAHVVDNWRGIMRQQKLLTWFSSGYAQLAVLFPFLVAAPRYFSGAIELGGLIQTAQAFGQVQGALSWFVTAYAELATWKATVDRLTGFEHALADIGRNGPAAISRRSGSPGSGVAMGNLDIWLPDGTCLLKGERLHLPPASRTLVAGPSGCGKSTLFRVIGGLWPYCSGELSLPAGERLLFLPQQPYTPIGSLRKAVSYPDPPETYGDALIRQTLTDCGLAALAADLDASAHWAHNLSPGEQQRLAFARALLLRPQWLFLDEATSALDEVSESRLYRLLLERLPFTAITSVAHRPSLAVFHNRRIDFTRNGVDGHWQLAASGGPGAAGAAGV